MLKESSMLKGEIFKQLCEEYNHILEEELMG